MWPTLTVIRCYCLYVLFVVLTQVLRERLQRLLGHEMPEILLYEALQKGRKGSQGIQLKTGSIVPTRDTRGQTHT